MNHRLVLLFTLAAASASAIADDTRLELVPSQFDRSVSICENPYAHVNNAWLRSTELPADRPMWGPRYAVIERNQQMQRAIAERAAARVASGTSDGPSALVGSFYASGMDQARIDAAGLAPVADLLAGIDTIGSREDLLEFIGRTSAQGLDLVFDYHVWARGEDPARHIIYIEQGGLGMDDRERYLADDEQSRSLRASYLAHLTRLLELSGIASADASRQAREAMAIETALARASLSRRELRDLGNIFAVRKLGEVGKIAPGIDWNRFLARHGHRDVAELSLAQPGFFRELDQQLSKATLPAWRGYLRARLLDATAPYLSRSFSEQHFAFHTKTVRGVPAQPERWKQVLDALNSGPAHFAMGQLFVDTHLPADAKPRALDMVADLKAAFRARLEQADWMNAQTRRAALAKLERMGAKIGYPDRWPDLSALAFDPGDYAGNMRALWAFDRKRDNARLRHPVDRAEWFSPAHEINARYYPQTNEIVFPAPMLLAPVFDAAADPAMNYGGLGIIIGHELTHGFDDQGAQFDASGKLHNWWTADDGERFAWKVARIADRYSAFEVAPGRTIDGKLTLGENIADLGGLAIAYDALMLALAKAPSPRIAGLTQSQRFFLRYASIWRNKIRPQFAELRLKTDPHAPDQVRAVLPLADMPAFSQAFGCKPGDGMYVEESGRIGVW